MSNKVFYISMKIIKNTKIHVIQNSKKEEDTKYPPKVCSILLVKLGEIFCRQKSNFKYVLQNGQNFCMNYNSS